MAPTKVESLSDSTKYRTTRCLFFWGLWSTGLVFVLLYTDVLRTDPQAMIRNLKLAEALIKTHATNTTTCTPIYESASLAATHNFSWRFTYILNLTGIFFLMPITQCYLLLAGDIDRDSCICLRCFFGLGVFLGCITVVSLDKEFTTLDAYLIIPATFNWITNLAMTMALALTGGCRAVWHTFLDIRYLGSWLGMLMKEVQENDRGEAEATRNPLACERLEEGTASDDDIDENACSDW
ncbi:hypothetical protein MMC18_004337 [Xylographa bjoerkii]|nr:hypothetical protein [Xylographa bjoerkii]